MNSKSTPPICSFGSFGEIIGGDWSSRPNKFDESLSDVSCKGFQISLLQ